MRIWLVEEKSGDDPGSLEALLRQLERRPGCELHLVGASPFQSDFVTAMRKLVPDLLDVIVLQEHGWPDGPWTEEVVELGTAVIVVTTPEHAGRFTTLAEQHPVTFLLPKPCPDQFWLTLLAAQAQQRRQAYWKTQVAHLQQRLADRIIVERAKGILVQRLSISEEEAYKRLRVLSRRQRRQIRDIAQSLLDTQGLFQTESNGFGSHPLEHRTTDAKATEPEA